MDVNKVLTKENMEVGGLLAIAMVLITAGAALIEAEQYPVGIALIALGIALILVREAVKEE